MSTMPKINSHKNMLPIDTVPKFILSTDTMAKNTRNLPTPKFILPVDTMPKIFCQRTLLYNTMTNGHCWHRMLWHYHTLTESELDDSFFFFFFFFSFFFFLDFFSFFFFLELWKKNILCQSVPKRSTYWFVKRKLILG